MATTDILKMTSLGNETETRLAPYLREVFINEAPILSRMVPEMASAQAYNIVTYDVRGRTLTLNAAINNTGTALTLTDATSVSVGDILELQSTAGTSRERVQVTAITSGTAVTILRSHDGATAVANDTTNNSNLSITLIGNTATGGDVNRVATRPSRTLIPQYVQTFQYACQVGGLAEALATANNGAVRLPAGVTSLMSMEQATKLTEMTRDIEYAFYYGTPIAQTSTKNATMGGLRHLIGWYNGGSTAAANSNVNVKTNGGASYTLLNFMAHAVQKALDGGGDPDTVIVSNDFATGLMTWGFGKQQLNQPRVTAIGTPINEVMYPFGSRPLTVIPSYQLAAGTAIALTARDVKVKAIREAYYKPRGSQGDADQGDFIGDYSIEVGHPGWHAWVSGITSFA
jgi:hypothetical protein